MATVSLSVDFANYLTLNWNESSISLPTTVKACNFNRDRQIQGYVNDALLIHRGQVHFVPVDVYRTSIAWITSILIYDTTAGNVEKLIKEFLTTVDNWEEAGGGAFTTNGIALAGYELSAFDYTCKYTAVGQISFFSNSATRYGRLD